MKTLSIVALAVAILFSANAAFAQESDAAAASELQRGITLYRQGAYQQAVNILEGLSKIKNVKDEPTVLNYLGLAYMGQNEMKKARKTFEKGVALAPQNAALRSNFAFALLKSNKPKEARREAGQAIALDAKLFISYFIRGTSFLWTGDFDEAVADADRAIAVNAGFAPAYTLKADALAAQFGKRTAGGANPREQAEVLGKAVEALEACRKKCTTSADIEAQRDKLESFKAFYDFFSRDKTAVLASAAASDPGTVPIGIISKPRAPYTDEARNAMISGTIVLAALFGANGKVTNVIVLKPLGYGLDEVAVRAAFGIKFTPAMKDGKPVPVVKTVEYIFSVR